MAIFFTGWWSELFFTSFALLLGFFLYHKIFLSQFWKRKNIPHVEPVFLLGNTWKALLLENIGFILSDMYRKWKDSKVVGFWNFTNPAILITDLEIVKNILTRDFSHFRDRSSHVDFSHDPLGANLFNLAGAKWRNLRVKLTPTFTSGKMKMMFPTMVACGEELQKYLKQVSERQEDVEMKEVLARFTTDIISSCAFGIETNSLKNPNSEFRKYGRKIFESPIRGILFSIFPGLLRLFKVPFTPSDVKDFFMNAVKETMEYRENNKVRRNDFMELLIELKKKGKLEDVDGVVPSTPEGDDHPIEDMKFTFSEAAAQAFVFFIAGFETSSTTLTFCLYELALNGDIQATLRKEIDRVMEKHEGKLTYEGINEMEYMNRVIQETLRKYPPVLFLFRECNKAYEIPELNAQIPPKVRVMIPVWGIQRDHQYFPNPEKFDPNRFSLEEQSRRHNFTYLPFGEGPRNCIGERFGLLQTKVGIVSILSKYIVEVSKETPIPLKFDRASIILAPVSGMPLRLVKRT